MGIFCRWKSGSRTAGRNGRSRIPAWTSTRHRAPFSIHRWKGPCPRPTAVPSPAVRADPPVPTIRRWATWCTILTHWATIWPVPLLYRSSSTPIHRPIYSVIRVSTTSAIRDSLLKIYKYYRIFFSFLTIFLIRFCIGLFVTVEAVAVWFQLFSVLLLLLLSLFVSAMKIKKILHFHSDLVTLYICIHAASV